MGKPIVMGRKTWESIGGALPGRQNIVITRQDNYAAEGADVVTSFDEALGAAGDADEVMIIGGAQLFAEAMPRADRIHLTHVDAEIEGDTFFPQFDHDKWMLMSAVSHAADERHAYAFDIRLYDRR